MLAAACLQTVVVSHSWGDNVFRNYMRWAENKQPGWCDKHIEAYVNIAGPVLGVPKAVTACLSGSHCCLACIAPSNGKLRLLLVTGQAWLAAIDIMLASSFHLLILACC